MNKVAGLKCWHCTREIGEKESYWGYHYLGGMMSSQVCLECLVYIDGPAVDGLLDLAERAGVPYARAALKRYREAPSMLERSEP